MKAHGFNTFSIYGHWGYHSVAEGQLDFENTAHNPRPILELAEELGMYVIWRPGPYVNAGMVPTIDQSLAITDHEIY